MVQTQHQDGDEACQNFSRDDLKLGKTLSKDVTFLGRPKKYN